MDPGSDQWKNFICLKRNLKPNSPHFSPVYFQSFFHISDIQMFLFDAEIEATNTIKRYATLIEEQES